MEHAPGGSQSCLKCSHPTCHHPASKLFSHKALQIKSFCLQPPSLLSQPPRTQTSTSTVYSQWCGHRGKAQAGRGSWPWRGGNLVSKAWRALRPVIPAATANPKPATGMPRKWRLLLLGALQLLGGHVEKFAFQPGTEE